jgi:hypothetical protein
MAAQRRAIKLTPFPKFIDRETGTRCLLALVAAVNIVVDLLAHSDSH